MIFDYLFLNRVKKTRRVSCVSQTRENEFRYVLFLLLFVCSPVFYLQAQVASPKVLAVGGNYSESGGYSLSRTIGEMTIIKTFYTSSIMLTQGFQQPERKASVGITDLGMAGGAVDLFPNPANDLFRLKYEFPQSGEFQMRIYNALGQQVSERFTDSYAIGERIFTFYTAELAVGIYYVNAIFTTKDDHQYPFVKKLIISR